MSAPTCFDLTPLTLGAAASRRAVIKTFEIRWQVGLIIMLSLPVGFIVAASLWWLAGSAAVLSVPAVAGTAVWLFDSRSSTGVKNWRRLYLRRKNNNGHVMVAGRRVDLAADYVIPIRQASAPVQPRQVRNPRPEPVLHTTPEEGWS